MEKTSVCEKTVPADAPGNPRLPNEDSGKINLDEIMSKVFLPTAFETEERKDDFRKFLSMGMDNPVLFSKAVVDSMNVIKQVKCIECKGLLYSFGIIPFSVYLKVGHDEGYKDLIYKLIYGFLVKFSSHAVPYDDFKQACEQIVTANEIFTLVTRFPTDLCTIFSICGETKTHAKEKK